VRGFGRALLLLLCLAAEAVPARADDAIVPPPPPQPSATETPAPPCSPASAEPDGPPAGVTEPAASAPAAPAAQAAPAAPAAPAAAEEVPASAPAAPPDSASTPTAPTDLGSPRMSADEWWSRALGTWRSPIEVPTPARKCWSGDVTVRFRGRYASDATDDDLYQYLRARYGREDTPGWSISTLFRLSEDLDGLARGKSFFVFDSVDDTYDSAVLGRLYHLYANYRTCGPVEQVRVGRQYVTAGDVFQMDGAHVTFAPQGQCCPTRLYVYGGIPTHLFESSIEGDWMVGAGASFEPWRGGSLEVADTYFQDKNDIYGEPTSNLFSLEGTQRVTDWLTVRGRYQHLNEYPRIASGSFDFVSPRCDLTIRGNLFAQLHTENQQVYDIDPYYAILQQLNPYYDVDLSGSKGIGRYLTAELGTHIRRLWNRDDTGTFNREFSEFYGTLSTTDWPRQNLSLALTGEWWNSPSSENVGAVAFDAEWNPSCRWRWSAGVDFSLYKTDLYLVEERYQNYGYYLRARFRPSPCWEFDGSVRLDEDDFDHYLTVNLVARWNF
jgi:hypothetical protein